MAKDSRFTAIVLEKTNGEITSSIQTLDESALPEGDVSVDVKYSALNYKDGMVLAGLGRLVRDYPHVPGIDFSGVVRASSSPRFEPGDEVILTGWRVGETHWGGYATRARVKSDWLIHLPKGLDLKRAMALGTAGLTAMLAVTALEEHGLSPDNVDDSDGRAPVLVTGAAGGVGSVSVALLANLGYRVAASTGRADAHDYLKSLGAAEIVERSELAEPPKGPLARERWAGVIDNVGGRQLAHVLAAVRQWGSLAAVGLAGGTEMTTSVLPFLLRGVNLLGINSTTCPQGRRQKAWSRLAAKMPKVKLDEISREIGLGQVVEEGARILQGKIRGRTVVRVGDGGETSR